MTNTPKEEPAESNSSLPESTPLTTLGSVIGFGLAVGISAGISSYVACGVIRSGLSVRGDDDWTAAFPAVLALVGLIDGAVHRYRRSMKNDGSTERVSSGGQLTKRLRGNAFCETGGYFVWAMLGLLVGGWIGIFWYGSFWGLLIGPAATSGLRLVLFWLFDQIQIEMAASRKKRGEESEADRQVRLVWQTVFWIVVIVLVMGVLFVKAIFHDGVFWPGGYV